MADSGNIYAGLIGEITDALAPYIEAAPLNIAAHFLVAFGNACASPSGEGPHFYVGPTKHSTNEFLLMVGPTAKGRKGEGKNGGLFALENGDKTWREHRVKSGLSSAEGLISAVRDPVMGTDRKGQEIVVDEGVLDKRLLAVESEFASVLRQADRPGNTLSPMLRDAWDRKSILSTLTKSPLQATNPIISLIGHSTREDLETNATSADAYNGFFNRFLIIETERVRELPMPSSIPNEIRENLGRQVAVAFSAARRCGEIKHTPGAETIFSEAYSKLTSLSSSAAGAVLSRGPAHVRRMALIYTMVRRATETDVEDIQNALAFWAECKRSVQSIFGSRTGDAMADKILREMPGSSDWSITMLRTKFFGSGNISSERLHRAIEAVLDADPEGFRTSTEKGKGRPTTVLSRMGRNGRNGRKTDDPF
jgi:hypothetical protein